MKIIDMEKNEEMKNPFMTSKDEFNEKIILEKHIFGFKFNKKFRTKFFFFDDIFFYIRNSASIIFQGNFYECLMFN